MSAKDIKPQPQDEQADEAKTDTTPDDRKAERKSNVAKVGH